MRVLNNNPLDLSAKAGETITIKITEENTVSQVGKSLNGQTLTENSFVVPPKPDPTLLTLSFGFSGNSGAGRYTITLTSSAGGDLSFFIVHEPTHGPKTDSFTYTIDVV